MYDTPSISLCLSPPRGGGEDSERRNVGYCQYPGCQAQPLGVCTHCPGTQAMARWGGSSQRPGLHTQPSLQVQDPGTHVCSREGATPLVSSGGAGGGCDTVLSLGRELGAVSLMIVVSRSTLRPPQAGRTISTVVANKRRHSVIRLMACFSLTLLYCSHSVSSLLFLYIGAADSRL